MKHQPRIPLRKPKGLAAVEMTLILPLLLVLSLAIVDLVRALQTHNAIVNISREGANLVSRSQSLSPQEIMNALALTADSLDFTDEGYIYINLVVSDGNASPYIEEQHRWSLGNNAIASKVWAGCTTWNGNDACAIPANRPRVSNFPLALQNGESVYVVEVLYDYQVITNFMFNSNLAIYSQTLM